MYHLPASTRPRFLDDANLRRDYAGKRVLVLGGDGFIGVHVATALGILGAEVTILSRRTTSLIENTTVKVLHGHLMQRETLERAFAEKDVIFDFVGSSGTVTSNRDPRRNLVSECEPHLNAFQVAAEMLNPPLIVFCSTRTVYGKPETLPVSETHRLAPESVYAIHKLTLEHYLQTFRLTHGLSYLIFRLSNPYGPYQWHGKKDYGIMNQFVWRAFNHEPIRLFGDGSQLRDYIFIDDVAEAFIRAAGRCECHNQLFNLGGPNPISMREAVEAIVQQRPGSKVTLEPWPADYQTVETGNYVTDTSKLRKYVPELQQTSFAEGLSRTFRAYDQLAEVATAPVASRTPSPSRSPNVAGIFAGRRVLVTGASGFVGTHLVSRLLKEGALVAAVHRKPLSAAVKTHPNVASINLDLEETERMQREIGAFEPEFIYHLASKPDGAELENHSTACIRTNLLVTAQLLEIARKVSAQAFIFADSTKVYGHSPVPHREDSATEPSSSYAASKLAAYNYCRLFAKLHALPVVALRPTLIYGPGQGFNLFAFLAKSLSTGKAEIVLDGGFQTRDPIFIDDAVSAYLRVAEYARQLSGRAIPIGGGKETSVKDLAAAFIQAAGFAVPVKSCGDRIRPTEMLRSYCDNVDAWEAFKWQPETALADGLRQTAEFLLGQKTASAKPV